MVLDLLAARLFRHLFQQLRPERTGLRRERSHHSQKHQDRKNSSHRTVPSWLRLIVNPGESRMGTEEIAAAISQEIDRYPGNLLRPLLSAPFVGYAISLGVCPAQRRIGRQPPTRTYNGQRAASIGLARAEESDNADK
jgi:hypothetical protein